LVLAARASGSLSAPQGAKDNALRNLMKEISA
jgi:hypothetical protein